MVAREDLIEHDRHADSACDDIRRDLDCVQQHPEDVVRARNSCLVHLHCHDIVAGDEAVSGEEEQFGGAFGRLVGGKRVVGDRGGHA